MRICCMANHLTHTFCLPSADPSDLGTFSPISRKFDGIHGASLRTIADVAYGCGPGGTKGKDFCHCDCKGGVEQFAEASINLICV